MFYSKIDMKFEISNMGNISPFLFVTETSEGVGNKLTSLMLKLSAGSF